MRIDHHLVVMTKPPRMGLAKTRLARDIGTTAAQRLNRMSQARTFRAIDGPWSVCVRVAPDGAVGHFRRRGCRAEPQGTGSLGDRLIRAVNALPPGSAIVVGTDTPDIGRRHIRRAWIALRRAELVLGPAEDGGFWLLGLTRTVRRRWRRRSPLRGVRWSSSKTMDDVVAGAGSGARIAFLERLIDIDDQESLANWYMARRDRRAGA